jgi:ATP-dependent Lhr-like helicase
MYPRANELLIEQIETKDGYHLFVYPFEGRLVHEAMAGHTRLPHQQNNTHNILFSQ